MRVEDGKLIYESRTCGTCDGTGRYRGNHPCPRYDRPQKGQPCPFCGSTTRYGHHYLPDAEDMVCPRCQRTLQEPETRCDYLPQEVLASIPIVVVHSNRAITWNESYLGVGCLWSTVDYGRHKTMTDEQLVAEVRDGRHSSVQATAVVDDQDRLPPFIAICCSDQGYSVRSAWKLPQLLREWDVETGHIVGMAVYHAGGHGTMAAAIGKPLK